MLTKDTRVEVYWNLHLQTFSYRPIGGRVQHSDYIHLRRAKFVVQPAGRERVLLEKRKNVHAFVRGSLVDVVKPEDAYTELLGAQTAANFSDHPDVWARVRYNPYLADTFLGPDNNPVYEAPQVILASGLIFALALR